MRSPGGAGPGRVTALGTPSELIGLSASPTVISFRPSRPLPGDALRTLPGLVSLSDHGGHLTITGSDNTANAVVALLAARNVTALTRPYIVCRSRDTKLGGRTPRRGWERTG